jgi:DNA-binding MarR family transcriptional regulator
MAATQKVSPAQVLDALTTRPGVSAAELADALGLGQSTAAKHLAALESAGTAQREPGGRDGGRRLPDRWTATAPKVENPAPADAEQTATEDTDPAADKPDTGASPAERLSRGALGTLVRDYLATRPGEDLGPTQVGKALGRSQGAVSNLCGSSLSSATTAEVAEALGISRSRAAKVLADLEERGQIVRTAGGIEGGRELADRWSASPGDVSVDGGAVRLRRGQLREMVLEHLRGHPGEVSPAQLSKVLGRSAGAISNLLAKAAAAGEVVQTSEHPRRYAAASR